MMAISLAMFMIIWILIQTTLNGLMAEYSTYSGKKDSSHRSYRSLDDYNQTTLKSAQDAALSFAQIDKIALNASLNYGLTIRNRMSRLEANLVSADIGLNNNTSSHNQYLFSHPSEDALNLQANADVVSKASLYLVQHHCQRYGLSNEKCARIVSTLKLDGTSLGRLCKSKNSIKCPINNRYRTIDGTCNNINNPRWGSALTPYSRIMFPNYYDGIQELRHAVRGRNLLPGPRVISISLSETQKNKINIASIKSLALMQWSEFIAHDLSHTVVRKMTGTNKPIRCCETNGNNLSPRYIHPDCAAISIPDDDPVYSKHNIRCMNYVRSLSALKVDCTFGPIEQMNQATHFLDGSTIYGSTKKRSEELRTFQGGKLKTDDWGDRSIEYDTEYLPLNGQNISSTKVSDPCPTGINNCYRSGDDRVNIDPILAVLHTIWHREHNRIAEELSKINPLWTDDIIFEETRRIVIAEIQHITYNEWLPIIVDDNYVIKKIQKYDYKAHEDPSVNNEAVTAVFQYINYLKDKKKRNVIKTEGNFNRKQNGYNRLNSTLLHLSEFFYKPRIIEVDDTFDNLIRSLSNQLRNIEDINMVANITELLNATNGSGKNVGLDVLSLDIQRGRDHGLASYNYYREYCGLSSAISFDDYLDVIPSEIVEKMKAFYDDPNDVDLIVGGMSEMVSDTNQTLLGPTFKCLLLEQLAKTRRTDKYFYDSRSQPYPFTPEQLNEIKRVSLARIFCDNGNNILQMQPEAFLSLSDNKNHLQDCDNYEAIPKLNLYAWSERSRFYI
ncbi:peroxidase-like isoform X2 [Chelonus insularis]|nr:peroxidase-like isoform X2 [Chelonus insularis]